MNNEKLNQIIDEVYAKYTDKYIGHEDIPVKEVFIREIKINPEFSEKWGLKIEERELNVNERISLAEQTTEIIPGFDGHFGDDEEVHLVLDTWDVPTKLITITYKNDKTEVYE